MTYREFECHPDWMKYPSADSTQNDKRNRRGGRHCHHASAREIGAIAVTLRVPCCRNASWAAPPTPLSKLEKAGDIGRKAGLRYVYLGNVAAGEDTLCHECHNLVIRRSSYRVIENRIQADGCCPSCGAKVAGIGMEKEGGKTVRKQKDISTSITPSACQEKKRFMSSDIAGFDLNFSDTREDRSSFRRTMKNFVAEPFSIGRRFCFQSFHAAEPLVFKWPKGPSRFCAIVVPPYQSCLKKGRFLFKQSQLIYKLG